MPRRHIRVTGAPEAPLRAALTALRTELGVPESFPPPVEAEAERAAKAPVRPSYDATDIPFFTVDPPTSRDLDQAMHLSRHGSRGYRVHYAIADVAAFVVPGGAVDAEAHRRANTLYFPDEKVPLHPSVLSEGAASLLPGETRPVALWTIDLDADGRTVTVDVRRALVRSRARLDYAAVQKQIDAGTAEEPLALLKEIGQARERLEVERGGISLNVPEQEIVQRNHAYELSFRAPLPADGWNAQISLLTGFAAASMMVYARIGILRTLPPPPPEAVTRLHRTARALGIDWPAEQTYADFIRGLDPTKASHEAMAVASTTLLRGAGYAAFDGEIPAQAEHAALASEYAHVTAPLRRLVDRYGLEVCVALSAGKDVPDWVRAALPDLPETMQKSSRLANQYENAVVDLLEAATLQGRVGERFPGVVVSAEPDDPHKGDAVIREPAVEARVTGDKPLPVGEDLELTLAEVDVDARTVRFTL